MRIEFYPSKTTLINVLSLLFCKSPFKLRHIRKKNENRKKITTRSSSTTPEASTATAQKQLRQEAVNEWLDETKDNIRRTTDAAIRQVLHYTKVFNDY